MEHECPGWVNVQGKDPQTGVTVDRFGCSTLTWANRIALEQSKHLLELGAAIESFRNEMVKSNNLALQLQAHDLGLLPKNGREV